MSSGDGLERLPESRFVECCADAASEDVVVDGGFWAVGGVEEHARLEFDERVGVARIGR